MFFPYFPLFIFNHYCAARQQADLSSPFMRLCICHTVSSANDSTH